MESATVNALCVTSLTLYSASPQVYLSTRRGAWVVGRVGAGGLPCDVVNGARLAVLMHRLMPASTTRAVEKQLNAHFDHQLYGLQPSHGYEGEKG